MLHDRHVLHDRHGTQVCWALTGVGQPIVSAGALIALAASMGEGEQVVLRHSNTPVAAWWWWLGWWWWWGGGVHVGAHSSEHLRKVTPSGTNGVPGVAYVVGESMVSLSAPPGPASKMSSTAQKWGPAGGQSRGLDELRCLPQESNRASQPPRAGRQAQPCKQVQCNGTQADEPPWKCTLT